MPGLKVLHADGTKFSPDSTRRPSPARDSKAAVAQGSNKAGMGESCMDCDRKMRLLTAAGGRVKQKRPWPCAHRGTNRVDVGGKLPQLHDLLPTLDVLGIGLLPCLWGRRERRQGRERANKNERSALAIIPKAGIE